MKKRKLHCSHAFHQVKCICLHPHFVHAGFEENEHCTMRGCKCSEFKAQPGYTQEQMIHDTVPVEGYKDRPRP